jgi:hypothetical protein
MIRNSIARAVSSLVTRPVNGAKLSFEIVMKNLFSNNEQGFFYDPNDLSTMYQDAAGTVPVTGVGQPVGLIRDKSGRNNHAYQTTSASRPILRKNAVTGANYLEFDGSDDSLQTNNIDFTATDKVSLFAGVRKLSDSTNGILLELSASITTNSGTFCVFAPRFTGGAGNFGLISKGTVLTEVSTPAILAPVSAVISVKSSILASVLSMRVNGALSASSNNSQGTGNYGNYPLYIGRRGGTLLPFNGHIYGLIGVGKLASDTETATIEKEIAKRVGVTLNV